MRMNWLVFLGCAALAGCCKSPSDSGSGGAGAGAAGASGDKNITITTGSDGGVKVTGGAPMKGDPKACAAFRACCSHTSMGLMCGLIEASGVDCSKALQSARDYLKEQKIAPPAGCN